MPAASHNARVYRGVGRKRPPLRVMNANLNGPYGSVLCAVCGFAVGLRADGRMRAHTVGTCRHDAIPCLGAVDRDGLA